MRTQVTEIVTSLIKSEITLVAAKAAINELFLATDVKTGYVATALDEACKARTKINFEASMNVMLDKFEQALDGIDKPLLEEEQLTALDQLAYEIKKELQVVGSSYFNVGNLLIEAQEASENNTEFLQWVDDNFNIKKAWCYRLMKVAKVFKDEIWCNTSTQVLYTLQAQANDEQMIEARLLAENDNLNHETLSILLSPVKLTISTEELSGEAPPLDAGFTFDSGTDTVINIGKSATNVAASPTPEVEDKLLSKIAELTATQAELLLRLEESQRIILEMKQPMLRKEPLHMLRQFASKDYAVRLGLSSEESKDKAAILDAFKSLCKFGYGRGHEAFALLDEARHELIHAL